MIDKRLVVLNKILEITGRKKPRRDLTTYRKQRVDPVNPQEGTLMCKLSSTFRLLLIFLASSPASFVLAEVRLPARDVDKVGALFNGRIAPITDMTIKGVIWYQGESNTRAAYTYGELFPALIRNWRCGRLRRIMARM